MEGSGGKVKVDWSQDPRIGRKHVEFGHQAEAVQGKAVEEQASVHFLDP